MATFEKSLDSKLKSLEPSQTGIQTLSLWIIHHRQQSDIVTKKWIERVKKGILSLFCMYGAMSMYRMYVFILKKNSFDVSCPFLEL